MNKRSIFISLLLVILAFTFVINTTCTFATDEDPAQESTSSQQQEETTNGLEDDSSSTSETQSTISTTKKVQRTHTITKVLKTFSPVQNITLEKGNATKIPTALSGSLKYDSGNSKIASVSSSGIVRANGIGTTYLRVYNDEFVQKFQITVSAPKETETDTSKETETETETSKNETVMLIDSNETSISDSSENVAPTADNTSERQNLKTRVILVTVLALAVLSLVAIIVYRRISSKDEDYSVDFETGFAQHPKDVFTDNSGVSNAYDSEEDDMDFDYYDDDNDFPEEDDDDIFINDSPDDSEDTFLL